MKIKKSFEENPLKLATKLNSHNFQTSALSHISIPFVNYVFDKIEKHSIHEFEFMSEKIYVD